MKKLSRTEQATLKNLKQQLTTLESNLLTAKRKEGIDDNLTIKVKKNKANYSKTKRDGAKDTVEGTFFILLTITAKANTIYVPISMASGKKQAGFMYQIEGTDTGAIGRASVDSRGEGVKEVTVGTIVYAMIPPKTTAEFRINVTIGGRVGQTYNIVINRINYKLSLDDTRYQQYLKPIVSDSVKFN